jgi:hypothetical protein
LIPKQFLILKLKKKTKKIRIEKNEDQILTKKQLVVHFGNFDKARGENQ